MLYQLAALVQEPLIADEQNSNEMLILTLDLLYYYLWQLSLSNLNDMNLRS
jgi:hypothetical protein